MGVSEAKPGLWTDLLLLLDAIISDLVGDLCIVFNLLEELDRVHYISHGP